MSEINAKIESIVVGENFRTEMNKKALLELSQNISQFGVIEPIIVRVVGKEMKLVAGARRLEAAKLAGLKTIPARIMELTDEKAEMVQAMENIHREDLNAIDEAEQYGMLLKEKSVKILAKEVNKEVKYIMRALALLNLPENIKKMIKTGQLKPEHGHILTRLTEDNLEKVIEYIIEVLKHSELSVTELKNHVDRLGKDLRYACFTDKTECAKCPHMTDNQSALFDKVLEGVCDNGECFNRKSEEFRKNVAEKMAKKECKDMKFLGTKTPHYSVTRGQQTIGKGVVITNDMKKIPAIKKALEKNREKFGFAIDKEGKEAMIVATDKELIEILSKKKTQETDWDQIRFIKDATRTAIIKEFMGKKEVGMTEMAKEIFVTLRMDEEISKEVCGEEEAELEDVKKVSLEKIIMGLWLNQMINEGDNGIERIKEVIGGKIIKEAEEKAEKDWPAEKERIAAEEKKNKENK